MGLFKRKKINPSAGLLEEIQEIPKCDYPNCEYFHPGIRIGWWGGQLVSRACMMCSRLKVGSRNNLIPKNPY